MLAFSGRAVLWADKGGPMLRVDAPIRKGDRATNLGDMEIFAEVVAAGSMTAAAQRLGLAVAGISKRIQRLESKLGARLLERSTRRIVLTEAGEGFHCRIGRVLEAFEDAVAFTNEVSGALAGHLRVVAPSGFGRLHVAPHVQKFLEAHPAIELELELSDASVDMLGSGFHLALHIGELSDSPLVAKKLAPMSDVLCAAPAYLAGAGEPLHVSDLGSHQLLAPKPESSWRLREDGEPLDVPVRGRLRTSSFDVIRQAVISGAGIALLPTWSIEQELAQGRLRRILPGCSRSCAGLFALYTSKELLPRKARAFIEFLGRLYGSRPAWEGRLQPNHEPLQLGSH
jgi:DNA-binding transcriptional LysR family regulator